MKLETIFENWQTDAVVDKTNVSEEAIKISALHSKYFKQLSHERLRLKQLQAEYKQVHRDKYEIYMHGPTKEQVDAGYKIPRVLVVKKDIQVYLEGDEDLQKLMTQIALQEEKVELLKSILQAIAQRSFNLRLVVDWEKFKAGL